MEFLYDGPPDAAVTLLLAHGAGAAMDSTSMNDITARLAARGLRVARFEFGYMAGRRVGIRRPPQKAESVTPEYLAAIDAVDCTGALLIGGRSFGGRVASLIADELYAASTIAGLVCIGYPFHPPEKPDQLRTAHLLEMRCPAIICQGTRDPFGGVTEVPGYSLSGAIDVHWLEDGDHELRPRKAISGRSYAQNLDDAADAVVTFSARVRA